MHFKEELRKTIFSGEKKFNLNDPDRYRCYGMIYETGIYKSKRDFRIGSVMVWGVFSDKGKLLIWFIGNNIDSIKYNGFEIRQFGTIC